MCENKEKNNQKSADCNEADFLPFSHTEPIEEVGTMIGPYKLLCILGEGGFGMVFLAEQKGPIRRHVALKVIKPGMDSKQIVARFESERQALALLDHPNIAHVFDAGTTEAGKPYFVMELIKGLPITEYCDQQRLKIEERLKLFQQVCEAVQHAHQKGIIHRDIKPSNILVSVHEGKPIPIIIDFGVAKAISQPLTERTLFTEQGQFIGTPEYMSPEQAGISIEDIDTRTDIYSLGVVLYELLTGILPFTRKELGRASFTEIQRVIRESETPRPSTRLSSLGGEEAKKIAAKRSTQIAMLTKRMQKELEWIPLKAMRKEPDRRYKTASELADDVTNYLSGEALIAGPESKAYRLKKIVIRHRAAVIGISAVLIALIIGFAVSTKMFLFAQRNANAYLYELYINYIAQAQNALQENNLLYAKQYLDKCPESLRGWEWDYLHNVNEQSNLVFKSHSDLPSDLMSNSILTVAINNPGTTIASGSTDCKVKIWDANGTELHTLTGHSGAVQCVVFNHDGTRIISGSSDGTIIIWDNNGRKLKTLQSDTDGVICLAVSPDGQEIISGNSDGTIKIWEVNTDIVPKSIAAHKDKVTSLVISPDGWEIVSGSRDRTICFQNILSGEILVRNCSAEINSLAISRDGKYLLSSDGDEGIIKVWDLKEKNFISRFQGHSLKITSLGFSTDGNLIASASYDQYIKIWGFDSNDVHNIKQQAKCLCSANSITAATLTPDSKHVIWGSLYGTVNAWDIKTDSQNQDKPQHIYHADDGISSVALSPDNKFVALGSIKSDRITILNAENFSKIKEWKHGTGLDAPIGILREIYGVTVSYSPNGQQLASGSVDGTIKIWDITTGDEICSFNEHKDWIASLSFSPDGRYLVSGSGDTTVKIWDVAGNNKKSLATIGGYESKKQDVYGFSFPACAAFSSDGKNIASGGPDGIIKIWDLNGNELGIMKGRDTGEIISISFSPDDSYIATGSSNNKIKIWSVNDCIEVRTLSGHIRPVLFISFSPDSRRIISSSLDNMVKIWDPFSGRELMTLRGHNSPVKTAIFSPYGDKIITGGPDRRLCIWEGTPMDVLRN